MPAFNTPAHLLLRLDDPAFELASIDHGAAHAAHEVTLCAVRRRNRDDVA
jgi:hypothetical protein